MDTTAAFTLSLFDRALRSELLGSLPNVATASELVTDAREASLSLDRESGMSFVPGAADGRVIRILPDQELARLRESAHVLLDTLRVLPASSATSLASNDGPLPEFGGRRPNWLAAVDLARSDGSILWADDRVLRDLAMQLGVRSFATTDLIGDLEATATLPGDVATVARAILIANGFVGQPLSIHDFESAADLVQWRDEALAICLRYGEFASVQDRLICLDRSLDGAKDQPELLGRLTHAFTAWVFETPVSASMRDGLIAATISGFLAKSWLDAGRLPFILDGVRHAYDDRGHTLALQTAVRNRFEILSRVADPATAANHLRGLFAFTRPEDRFAVTEITLTTGLRQKG